VANIRGCDLVEHLNALAFYGDEHCDYKGLLAFGRVKPKCIGRSLTGRFGRKVFYAVMMFLTINSLIMPILGSQRSQSISSYGTIRESTGHVTLLAIKVDNLSPLTDGQLRNLAKYDLLITYAASYNKAQIEKLRLYNPLMKIFGYRNVAFVDEHSTQDIELARANGWVLRDNAGNEVYEKNYPSLKLVDVGNADYREWVAERIRYLMTELVSIDGVFGDGTSALIDLYTVSARPINPATGALYEDQDWRDGTIALVRRVKEVTRMEYLANGGGMMSGSGTTGFWRNQQLAEALIEVVDGVFLEGFIRWETENWRSASAWKQDVEFLDYLNKRSKTAIAWTQSTSTPPPGATQYQVAMYGYASYLLAASGDKSYFRAKHYDEEFYNVTRIDVGHPLEEYHIRDDNPVYEREFSKSLILLNPTDNNYTLNLRGNYETIEGKLILGLELPAKNGIILIKRP